MKDIRNEILSELKELDVFKYTNSLERGLCQKIYEKEVDEALQYHCNKSEYSSVFKQQLIDLHMNKYVEICGHKHPYEPFDIYLAIEGVANDCVRHKPFERKTSFLYNKNIYHTHHSQNFYSMYNFIRFFKSTFKNDNDVYKHMAKLELERPEVNNIVSEFVAGVFVESLTWPKKTGEWLVYQMNKNKIRFLCLYIHDAEDKNDEGLFSLIKEEIYT